MGIQEGTPTSYDGQATDLKGTFGRESSRHPLFTKERTEVEIRVRLETVSLDPTFKLAESRYMQLPLHTVHVPYVSNYSVQGTGTRRIPVRSLTMTYYIEGIGKIFDTIHYVLFTHSLFSFLNVFLSSSRNS